VSFQKGKLTSPFGTEFVGFIITIGGVTDPADIHRTYEDIDNIFKSNPEKFKIHETRDENGRFKSYSVSTDEE
jgi:hypothetical protein